MAPTSCSLPVAHQNFTTWVIFILPSKVEKCIGWKSCLEATRDSTSFQVSCELIIFFQCTVDGLFLVFALFFFSFLLLLLLFLVCLLLVFYFLLSFFFLLVLNARQIAVFTVTSGLDTQTRLMGHFPLYRPLSLVCMQL